MITYVLAILTTIKELKSHANLFKFSPSSRCVQFYPFNSAFFCLMPVHCVVSKHGLWTAPNTGNSISANIPSFQIDREHAMVDFWRGWEANDTRRCHYVWDKARE